MPGYIQYDHNLYLPIGLCNRSYKFVTFTNGLIALLISDPTQDMSSVALSVSTGAYNDPEEFPGLAHFCEHMIMLQSKKYPEINKLQKLIVGSNCGMMNAYTTGELTSFYYQLKCPNNDFAPLLESLDIFSSLLKEPLFSPDYIKREIIAIDNEHTRNKTSLTKVLFHGLRLISSFKKTNIFNRFATGNFQTLSNSNPKLLREKLVDYYQNNFTPEKFVFVIKSPQSINTLQKIFLSCFSWLNEEAYSMPNAYNSILMHSQKVFNYTKSSTPPFTENETNRCLFIKSNKNISTTNSNLIRVIFPLSYDISKVEESRETLIFTNFLTNFLGCDTKSSIFHTLQPTTGEPTRYLVDSLNCFVSEIKEGNHCLVIELYPTKIGTKNLSKIIQSIFLTISKNFIDCNRNSTEYTELMINVAKALSEFSIIESVNYLYSDSDESPMDEVCEYATNLQQCLEIMGEKWLLAGIPAISELEDFSGYYDDDPSWWLSLAEKLQRFVMKNLSYNNFNLIIYGDETFLDFNYSKSQDMPSLLVNDDYYHKVNNLHQLNDLKFLYYVDPHFLFQYNYYKINLDPIFLPSPKRSFRNCLNSCIIDSLDEHTLNSQPQNIFIPSFSQNYKFMNAKYLECQQISKTNSLGFNNTKVNNHDGFPKLIDKSENYQIWVKQESQMKYMEKCIISFDILNLDIKPTINRVICNEILNEIVSIKLDKMLKSCEVLGYNWNIATSSKNDVRMGFLLSGYLEKIPVILEIIERTFTSMRNNYEEFISDKLYHQCWLKIKGIYNDLGTGKNSLEKAIAGSLVVLEENSYLLEDRLEELSEVTYEDVQFLFGELFGCQSIYSNIFIQGNITKAFICHILSTIVKISNNMLSFDIRAGSPNHIRSPSISSSNQPLSSCPSIADNYQRIISNKISFPTTHVIPPGKNYYIHEKSGDLTNSILYFVQFGIKDDIYIRTMARLVSYFISMDTISELRTNKQLGYAVFSGVRIYKATIGIHISIASGVYKPKILESEINSFLLKMESKLSKMSEKDFNELIKYNFLKMYIYIKNSDPEYMKTFFSKLNGENIEFLINSNIFGAKSDLEGDNKDMLEDLSSVSALRTGSCLDNLNTQQIKSHTKIWEELVSQTYRFSSIRTNYTAYNQCDESFAILDLLIVNRLTKAEFSAFWNSRVSVRSPTISKLSIFISMPDANEESEDESVLDHRVENGINDEEFGDATYADNEDPDNEQIEMIASQVEILLRMNNLLIPHGTMVEIVANSNCNQSLIIKELMKYFSKNGEKLKVYAMILRTIFKTLNQSLRMMVSKKNKGKIDGICEREVKLEKIESISDFKKECSPV